MAQWCGAQTLDHFVSHHGGSNLSSATCEESQGLLAEGVWFSPGTRVSSHDWLA